MYLLSIANRVRASELLKGFATTTFWSALSKLLIVLTTLYCSNVLTQDEFGEFSFIRNTLSTVLLICATNFSGLAVKFAAEATTLFHYFEQCFQRNLLKSSIFFSFSQ